MNILLSFLLATGLISFQQQTVKPRQGSYAVTNVTIETVSNGTIENGTIVVRGDRITAVGTNVDIPADAEVIDGSGLSVYPGLIDSGTRLGLTEIGSVQETTDSNEIGDITPQMQALTAINPNSVLIPVTRVSGVTTVISEPSGGMLPGTATMINLVGYTPEQMHAGDVRLLILEFPRKSSGGRRFGQAESDKDDSDARYKRAMEKLNEVWDRAELYEHIDAAYMADSNVGVRPEYAPEMAAIAPVIRGEMILMVKVNAEKDILAAIDWVASREIVEVVFSGVAEGWRVADKLADAGISCIVGPVFSMPTRQTDRYDRAYSNAGLLNDAGVKVAIRSGDAANVRNLPFNAGFAAAYGLGKEEALRAVTLTPAEIFGVADDYGSIEVGKKANFFISDGDPFEPATQIVGLFIDGFNVPIDSQHIRLYKEFLNRDEGRIQSVEVIPAVN
ncbi:MAG: amidohydrolase family protein [Bacteroidetes bacterium]|nr:amidohydrolase family protein [Bacteroidota bacterium]